MFVRRDDGRRNKDFVRDLYSPDEEKQRWREKIQGPGEKKVRTR